MSIYLSKSGLNARIEHESLRISQVFTPLTFPSVTTWTLDLIGIIDQELTHNPHARAAGVRSNFLQSVCHMMCCQHQDLLHTFLRQCACVHFAIK